MGEAKEKKNKKAKKQDKKKKKEKKKEKSQADILLEFMNGAKYICDELNQPYAIVPVDDHRELMRVGPGRFTDWLIREYFMSKGKAPGVDSLHQAMNTIKAMSRFQGEERQLQRRVAEKDGNFYYDLCEKGWRVVKITSEGCKILKNAPFLFVKSQNMKAQVEPDFKGDIQLLRKHLRIRKESNWILCFVYIVTCLIPNIPHPVLVIAGEKGSSKSTTLRMLRCIIDPAAKELLTMPNSKQDLALTLSKSYMPCFDNLDNLSAEKSDLLCMASTGGGISKRMLYTDDEEVTLSFKRCVGMNGINVVATRADLLDRALILELSRIPETERKEESIVWEEFNNDLPQIIGGAMTVLSKAMKIYPEVKLDRLLRMADFTRWGYAIAEAMGIGGEKFLSAYEKNQSYANEEAIDSHPVAAAIVAYMAKNSKWNGSVTDFLMQLEIIAEREKINTTSKVWPKASHVLSKRLKEIKSNLEQKGIFYSIRSGGTAKMINIEKKVKETEKEA